MILNLPPYPTYSLSSLDWLPEIPTHWRNERGKWLFKKMKRPVRDTDEVVTCFRDGTVTLRKNRRTEGFTESLQEIGYQGIRAGDLVIHAMDAFAGATGVADSDGKGTPVYAVCRPESHVNAYYFAYILREMARSQWIAALAKGIRERSTDFRFATLAPQRLPLPPLAEQRAIACYLDHVDGRIQRYIEAKEQLIALLQEARQAIIQRAVTRGLDPDVPLKPSGVDWLGDVPAHWEVTATKRHYAIQLGKMLQSVPKRPEDVEVPYLKALHVQWFDVLTSDVPTMWASHYETRLLGIEPGDLLVCEGGEGGRCAILTDQIDNCIIEKALHRVRPREQSLNVYLQYVMSTVAAIGWFDVINNKATIAHFTREKFDALRIPVPPLAEQRAVAAHLDQATAAIDAAIDNARRQSERMAEYRASLIAHVVTGKLDVRAAVNLLQDAPEQEAPVH